VGHTTQRRYLAVKKDTNSKDKKTSESYEVAMTIKVIESGSVKFNPLRTVIASLCLSLKNKKKKRKKKA
jgi:hypothetical protein